MTTPDDAQPGEPEGTFPPNLDQALAAFHQAMGGVTAPGALGITPLDEAAAGLRVLYLSLRRAEFGENEALKYMAFLGWKDAQ